MCRRLWHGRTFHQEQETESTAVEIQTEAVQMTTTEEELTVEPEILEEIEENRGEFFKEYLLSDNSRTVVVYPEQIHYENEDEAHWNFFTSGGTGKGGASQPVIDILTQNGINHTISFY